MGCKQSTVIPVNSVETSHKNPKLLKKEEVRAMQAIKTATEEDRPIDIERQKETEMKVIQQLRESDTLKKSYIGSGGVAYNIGLKSDHDSMLVVPACPERITRRLEKPKTSYFSAEEKELMAGILKKQEMTSKGNAARIITEKQEKAKERRAERQREITEKIERKRKLTEERLKKLEKRRKEKLDNMTEAILRN